MSCLIQIFPTQFHDETSASVSALANFKVGSAQWISQVPSIKGVQKQIPKWAGKDFSIRLLFFQTVPALAQNFSMSQTLKSSHRFLLTLMGMSTSLLSLSKKKKKIKCWSKCLNLLQHPHKHASSDEAGAI